MGYLSHKIWSPELSRFDNFAPILRRFGLATACDRMPPHPNACHNDDNSDNDNEHDNKTDNDDDNADALIISDASLSDYSFETVWSMYGKPVGNVEVLKAKWNSLSAKNKDSILSYIP